MKIGKRLPRIIDLLDEAGLLEHCAFVSRAGMSGQQIVTDLQSLRHQDPYVGHLSIFFIHANSGGAQ